MSHMKSVDQVDNRYEEEEVDEVDERYETYLIGFR